MFDSGGCPLDFGDGAGGVDLAEDFECFFVAVVVEQVSRCFRQEGQESDEEERGDSAYSEHVSPALIDMRKRSTEGVGDYLATGYEGRVDGYHSPATVRRRELSDVDPGS